MNLQAEIFSIDPNASYEAEEVAALLFRTTLRSFNRHRRQRALEGFPKPISRWGKKVWSGAALLAWRDGPRGAGGAPVVDFGAELKARAAAISRRRHA